MNYTKQNNQANGQKKRPSLILFNIILIIEQKAEK